MSDIMTAILAFIGVIGIGVGSYLQGYAKGRRAKEGL